MPPSIFNMDVSTDSSLRAARFAEAVERLQAGERVDVRSLCVDCPPLREELEVLLPTLEAVVDLERNLASDEPLEFIGCEPVRQTLGDYRILREIGRGGMGIVYEAEQISLGRRIALKVLPFAATVTPQQLQRFKNEARAAATLKHPHIVGVHSVGVERGVHYYAMELVEGRSLAQVMAELRTVVTGKSKPINSSDTSAGAKTAPVAVLSTVRTTDSQNYFREVARLIADAADALGYAHDQGVVHRDVKPANLLIDERLHIWVADFGLARLESDAGVTLTGDLLGTLRYMSPEQAAGKPGMVDYRTDIHALGTTLYELIALRPPFDTDDRGELLRQVSDQMPPSLCSLDARIPQDLETIVGKAMEKAPMDRYESAGQLAADLRAFAADRPITARPPTLGVRLHKWARRHSTAVSLGFVVMLVGIVGLTVSTAMVGNQRSVAIQNAETARRNAKKADENLQLALTALEETLAESVAGNLVVEYGDEKHKELERRGIDFYEEFARQNDVDPSIWPTYQLLVCNQQLEQGFVLRTSDPDTAENAFRQALSTAEQLYAHDSNDPRYQAKLIHCLQELAVYLNEIGRREEVETYSKRSGALAQELLTNHLEFLPAQYLLGINHYNEGVWLQNAGQLSNAGQSYRNALPHLRDALYSEPNEVRNPHALAMCQYNLAMSYAGRGESEKAKENWQKSFNTWKGLMFMRPSRSEFQSRAAATLSNLAVLARQSEDYQHCCKLAEEALDLQKHALKIEPVYEHAKDFLRKHYKQLSLALSTLHDRERLAEIAEERVAFFPDVPGEHYDAAMSLGDCMEQLYSDTEYAGEDRQQLMDGYARRAFELLDDASERFQDNHALFTIARAYLTLGDGCVEMARTTDARRAWLSAERQYKRVQAAVSPEDRHGFDEYLGSVRERLSSIEPATE